LPARVSGALLAIDLAGCGEHDFYMDRLAIFQSTEPAAADMAEALAALGIRLSPADLQKAAENAALLARHWQALAPAMAPEAADQAQ
jgi:hypothetical protein